MKKIKEYELENIKGGNVAITATVINAICRLGDLLFSLGESFGSAIKRSTSGNSCEFK